ncbi:MAG: phosphoribosylamine--glycine ligase [Bacteroidales bacterium]
MNVLILGSGGREHALAWKISQSRLLDKLFIAPGNAGTQKHGKNVNLKVNDFEAIGTFCLEKNIDMVVVGPEEPLVKGIKDYFYGRDTSPVKKELSPCEESKADNVEPLTGEGSNNKKSAGEKSSRSKKLSGISVIGPDSVGALLEGSKAFAKQFMKKYGIPTARYLPVTKETISEGYGFLDTLKPPYVLKADGLAAGKGVLIIDDQKEAESELKSMLEGKFGDASCRVVIEEHLSGRELSVFVLTDGKNYLLLPEAKDYKRIGENDTGPNTGGMGSVSPVPFADHEFMKKVELRIIKPTITGLQKEKIDYRGFIFFGLMNVKGDPYVIEYNVRLGDPETEAIMPRIKNDLLELMADMEKQMLKKHTIDIDPRTVASVMLVSGGYPGSYKKGIEISEPGTAGSSGENIIFHAGTTGQKGKVLTSGGRVMAVSSIAGTMEKALERCYRTAEVIEFEGKYFRRDIGRDIL